MEKCTEEPYMVHVRVKYLLCWLIVDTASLLLDEILFKWNVKTQYLLCFGICKYCSFTWEGRCKGYGESLPHVTMLEVIYSNSEAYVFSKLSLVFLKKKFFKSHKKKGGSWASWIKCFVTQKRTLRFTEINKMLWWNHISFITLLDHILDYPYYHFVKCAAVFG